MKVIRPRVAVVGKPSFVLICFQFFYPYTEDFYCSPFFRGITYHSFRTVKRIAGVRAFARSCVMFFYYYFFFVLRF